MRRATRGTACPETSFGPWSPVYTSTNTPFARGSLDPVATISDAISTATTPTVHHLMPAFAFSGDTGTSGTSTGLYRVYVATDKDCVNVVFRGAIVGSPAYAPRWNGTLALPSTVAAQTASRTQFASSRRRRPDEHGRLDSRDRERSHGVEPTRRRSRAARTTLRRTATPTPPRHPTTTAVTKPAAFPAATLAVDPGASARRSTSGTPTGRPGATTGRSSPSAAQVKSSLTTRLGATAAAGATTVVVAAGDQLAVGDVLDDRNRPGQESVTVVTVSSGAVDRLARARERARSGRHGAPRRAAN